MDKKDKVIGQSTGEMNVRTAIINWWRCYFHHKQTSQFQNAEAKGEVVVSLEYPTNMNVGQSLPDGFLDMDIGIESEFQQI